MLPAADRHGPFRHDPLTSQVQSQQLDLRGRPGNHSYEAKLEKNFYKHCC
jgi:hypothetical protein